MPKKVQADPAEPAARVPGLAEPVEGERQVMVSFPVSETLHYALKVKAAQERTTVRGMIMRALKAVGLEVPDADLIDRRPGRAGRKAREG